MKNIGGKIENNPISDLFFLKKISVDKFHCLISFEEENPLQYERNEEFHHQISKVA